MTPPLGHKPIHQPVVLIHQQIADDLKDGRLNEHKNVYAFNLGKGLKTAFQDNKTLHKMTDTQVRDAIANYCFGKSSGQGVTVTDFDACGFMEALDKGEVKIPPKIAKAPKPALPKGGKPADSPAGKLDDIDLVTNGNLDDIDSNPTHNEETAPDKEDDGKYAALPGRAGMGPWAWRGIKAAGRTVWQWGGKAVNVVGKVGGLFLERLSILTMPLIYTGPGSGFDGFGGGLPEA